MISAAGRAKTDRDSHGGELGLRGKSVVALLLACALALVPAVLLGWRAMDDIRTHFGLAYAKNFTLLHRQKILAPVSRELALSRRFAESVVTRDWLLKEDDPARRALLPRGRGLPRRLPRPRLLHHRQRLPALLLQRRQPTLQRTAALHPGGRRPGRRLVLQYPAQQRRLQHQRQCRQQAEPDQGLVQPGDPRPGPAHRPGRQRPGPERLPRRLHHRPRAGRDADDRRRRRRHPGPPGPPPDRLQLRRRRPSERHRVFDLLDQPEQRDALREAMRLARAKAGSVHCLWPASTAASNSSPWPTFPNCAGTCSPPSTCTPPRS